MFLLVWRWYKTWWEVSARGDTNQIHSRAGLPSRETSASWRSGPTETSWNSERVKAKSFTWGGRTANINRTDWRNQPHWKGPGGLGRQGGQATWKPAVCLGSKGSQQHPGLYSQEQSQESEGSDEYLRSALVRPHLDTSVQQRHH